MSTLHPYVELAMKRDAERNEARVTRFCIAVGQAHDKLGVFFNLLMNEETTPKIEERHIRRAKRLLRQIEEILS